MFTLKPAVLAIVMCLVFLFSPLTVWGGQREITLKLGGQYCGAYLGDVKNALKKLHGIGRPAKLAVGRSSAVADERTARRTSSP